MHWTRAENALSTKRGNEKWRIMGFWTIYNNTSRLYSTTTTFISHIEGSNGKKKLEDGKGESKRKELFLLSFLFCGLGGGERGRGSQITYIISYPISIM